MRNTTRAAIFLSLGLIGIAILVAAIQDPAHDDNGQAIMSAGLIAALVAGFLLVMVGVLLGFPALRRAISEHRLANPANVVARWQLGREEWARFRALDQARAAQFPTFRNHLDSDAPAPREGVDVVVGRKDVRMGASACAIWSGLGGCILIDAEWLEAEPAAIEFAFLERQGRNSTMLRVARLPVASGAEIEARRALALHQAAIDPEMRTGWMDYYKEHFLARDVAPARGHVVRRARIIDESAWLVIIFALIAAAAGVYLLFSGEVSRDIARWLALGGGAIAIVAVVIAFVFRDRG